MSLKEQINPANPPVSLRIEYPASLPVSERRDEIKTLISNHQVVIVCGETGSGKTTQLPKMCLELGRGLKGRAIVHTQPRRLAATSTAKRIAQELQSEIGQWVGYKIRFEDKAQGKTPIKLVTDGILLAESQRDPLFKAYDTIIIDEAHERSLNIDFLLGYLKEVLPKRPDLKVIVTSATIDAQRFATHFEQENGEPAPVIEVSGRLYPVEMRFKDPQDFDPRKRKSDLSPKNQQVEVDEDVFQAAALDAIEELGREGDGDILFFLPGEREIRDMAQLLRRQIREHIEILPLYARLSAKDQERIFKSSGRQRIILSTNVAETSLTVPGIRYVIDSGTARLKRYSYRNKVEQLQIERISKASANQRAGRCGRVANGVCIRLYSEDDFASRSDFTDPEILRSSLASVILRMKSLKLAAVEEFPFLQRPMGRAIADGYQLLGELNAIDEEGRLTKVGQALGRLPVDPRIGRMMAEAQYLGCLSELLIIASGLSIQDPRERPHDAQQAADQAHEIFKDDQSDFNVYLNIWYWYQKAKEGRESQRDLRNKLTKRFLNANRMREWSEVHFQLVTLAKEQGWHLNTSKATSEQVHLALLSGLLGNVGCRHEKEPIYLGARGIKFSVHPSSFIHKKAGKWIIASELVETTRLYGRCIANIKPEWIERIGKHLVKKNHTDPHWEKSSGQAVAFETGTLYGLPVYSRRRVSLANFNRTDARTIMITEGLVAGQLKTNLGFYQHNCRLIAELEKLEHKARRQDILVEEALIAEFYEQRIPKDAFNQKSLESWCKTAPPEALEGLKLCREDLLNKQAGGVTTDMYPKVTEHAGLTFKLNYHFEPGSLKDGVTLEVPLMLLNQVNPVRCEWLVPGLLKDKALLLLKSLPQKLRRHCVPVPQFAARFAESRLEAQTWDKPLVESLRDFIVNETPARPNLSDFRLEGLPPHLFMNFKLLDEHGRQLDMQRSLSTLKAQWGRQASENFKQSTEVKQARQEVKISPDSEGSRNKSSLSENTPSVVDAEQQITSWSFGELPELLEIKKGGQVIYGYPALKDCGDYCVLEVYDEEEMARKIHFRGLIRLFSFALKDTLKFLKKNLSDFQQVSMMYLPLGNAEELREQWIGLAIVRSGMQGILPRSEQEFVHRVQEAKSRMNLIAQEIGRVLKSTLTELLVIQKKLQMASKVFPLAVDDIEKQIEWLFPKDFLLSRPWEQIQHYPRYLNAAQVRLEKIRKAPERDEQNMREIQKLHLNLVRVQAKLRGFEDESLTQFAWQLQELRVGLFAQELKTPMPVSVKRLQKAWEAIERRHN